MKLSPRLQMAAQMVRPGVAVADIGTDHAYLPVYLLQKGISNAVLACDVGVAPLENARQTLVYFGLETQISLRLSDGLDAIQADEAEDFLFTGMGGTLITRLLARTAWIYDGNKRFIFQPMTRAEELRTFLLRNRFVIPEENACRDDGRLYIAFSAQYTGEEKSYPLSYPYIGELPRCASPLAREYIQKQYYRVQRRADALDAAALQAEEVRTLRQIAQEIQMHF